MKLVAPEISLGGNFSFDSNGQFYSTTKVYGYIKKANCPMSYYMLLGLLNSKLFWFFIQNTGYILRGGYYAFKTNYVIPFPIPKMDGISQSIVEDIEFNVQKILYNKKNNIDYENSVLMEKIDNDFFYIYGLEHNEIQVIISNS